MHQKEAQNDFEQFMANRKHRDPKSELLVNAYEAVLYHERRGERQILNKKRDIEIQKNRPPRDYWYELKSEEFF